MDHEVNQVNMPQIDLRLLLGDLFQAAKRLLLLGVLLAVLCAAVFGWRSYRSYSPVYKATASFTVTVTNPLYAGVRTYNAATAEQMAKTFPTILTTGVLRDRVKERLGTAAIPAINASVHNNTNIFTLSVTSGDPQFAYDVLQAVIECYPEIAEFVIGPTNMSLLDESGVPTQPTNQRNIVPALKRGAVIGIILWAAFILLITLTRSTIHNEDELKTVTNLRCLGTIPQNGPRRRKEKSSWPLLSEGTDRFGFSESMRLTRIRVEKELKKQGWKVILVSSAIPGEGKTTVSSNLALSLAQKGKRTLLIDLDLRSPSVNRVFGQKSSPGVTDLLKGKKKADIIRASEADKNFFTIYAGAPAANAAELLSREELKDLISTAREVFDYVVLDTPPCAMLSDAAEAAALADCALLTIRQNYSSRDQILEGARFLSDSHLPLIGCVLNGAQRSILTGGYGYGAGYGYGYGSRGKGAENDSAE